MTYVNTRQSYWRFLENTLNKMVNIPLLRRYKSRKGLKKDVIVKLFVYWFSLKLGLCLWNEERISSYPVMIVLGGCCCKTDGDFFKEKGCLHCLHRGQKKKKRELTFFFPVTASFTVFFHQHQSIPVNNQVPVVPCRARSTKDIRTSNKLRAKCQKRLYRKAH